MNIAFIAHDRKKELLVNLCIAYTDIIKKHNLFATGTTGKVMKEHLELDVYTFSPGLLGGVEQISARILYNEIDMVIFLVDSSARIGYEPDLTSLMKLCDNHSIPYATNIATAEILIKGLERGDLDWRELLH
mgnify:FL=1